MTGLAGKSDELCLCCLSYPGLESGRRVPRLWRERTGGV